MADPRRARADHHAVLRGARARRDENARALELHVVVDYGVNLAEVTEMVRSRVAYEIERHTGLPVKAVDVHVDSARRAE